MPLIRIEVNDFKSYRGHEVIGPFKKFTSVIGPDGAEKSNLIDAISFVLGVKSAQLRSSQLKDFVYRGRRLAKGPLDGSEATQDQDDDDKSDGEGEGTAKKVWVLAVFQDEKRKEWLFQRIISSTRASEYCLDNKVVTYSAYNTAPTSHNILVKAKNFLVFQGDVEAVMSQSPRELSRLIEQISEYEKTKEAQERAENATFTFTKRRGIAGETKQYKEQKGEAEHLESLCDQKDDLIFLYKLFPIKEALEANASRHTNTLNTLAGLRAEQARARIAVVREETKVKKAEKALEAKIKHSSKKLQNSQKIQEQVGNDAERQQAKLHSLRRDLSNARQAADEAADVHLNITLSSARTVLTSQTEKHQLGVLAFSERQALETLSRDEKTASRTLTQVRATDEELQRNQERLRCSFEAEGQD
ncbi:P-loop containing nucleoside triphosphate hydrolase protein [Suillus occidentalis]|nr:P-loop containing nucleoside triphosphate hydrolase protein [Suillus occidentalis]